MVNEILDDPKLARMSDDLFRSFVLLLAAANEAGCGGRLPELDILAWRLRMPTETLMGHLESLSVIRSAHMDKKGRWYITNFAKRQAAATPAERMAHMRQARAQNGRNSPLRNVTANVTELELKKSKTYAPKKRARLTAPPPLSSQTFRQIVHRYPPKALYEEIHTAVGETPEAIDFWSKVVLAWISIGWNPMNVAGMLDCFKRKEIPHVDRPSQDRHGNVTPKVEPNHDYFIPPNMRPK